MTEQPAQDPAPEPPAVPHEGPLARTEDWFRDHGGQLRAGAKDAAVIAEELKPLLQGHASGMFALAAKVLASPELKAIAPDVLDLVLSAAQIAGVAL